MSETVENLLQRFDISKYGFLPVEEPLARLPDPYYKPWEDLIARLPQLLEKKGYYEKVSALPILSTVHLHSIPEWRRAYVILTLFTHAHTWGAEQPKEILPATIARPLLQVSNHLGLPPVATYPALNLWNCGLIADDADITNPENVIMRHTLTGTYDEAWFYAVSVSVEAQGVHAIKLMLECIHAVEAQDEETIHKSLQRFSSIIQQLGKTLDRMHEHCDPSVFYYRIRPFLAGSKGMEKAGLPKGVFYDEGNGKGSWRQYSGGSNAQSSLIQFLDISLGVRHQSNGEASGSIAKSKTTYLDEMRNYMPIRHRDFLDHYKSVANVHEYAMARSEDSLTRTAFNEAVDSLTAFRDIHIKIVARYIIMPSRMPKPVNFTTVKNLASASPEQSTGKDELRGTGGTSLMTFLKQTRDETRAAKSQVVV